MGKHKGDQPKLKPFQPPAPGKKEGDSDGGKGGSHGGGPKK
ncbi:hypothetical protein ACI2LC_16485 [Nonomuraea wenchangensis]